MTCDLYPARQYVRYIIEPSATRPGKTDKITVHPVTGKKHDAHDPAIWLTHAEAQTSTIGHGVGIVITEQDNLFAIDLDRCRCEDGSWSPLAVQMCQFFAGCYQEVSYSQEGLHIIGSTSAPIEHGTRDIHNAGLEAYSKLRFIALTGNGATGSMLHQADEQFRWLASAYFPIGQTVTPSDWQHGPCDGYNGPTDDDELITRMLASRTSPFSNSIPLTDLWAGVCDPDGQSEADAALVSHLSFWTGRDCDRIDRLFRRSGLMRPKWDRSAGQGRTYGQLTIAKYGTSSMAVYGQRDTVQAEPPVTLTTSTGIEGVYRGGGQIMTAQQQLNYFRGCVYVRSLHKVFVPDGDLLDVGQFRATYGGYEFMVEEGNSKGTKNAWEAFTESRSMTFPRVQDTCFRPECPPGSIITEEGRTLVNTYIPAITEIKPGDPARFLDHIRKMIPDQYDYEVLMAYMAAVVQYPGVKFQWCPVLIGMEGNGKSLVIRALSHCIGSRYTHLPNAQDLANKFNSWLQGKLLIGVEEIYTVDRAEFAESLKIMITNPRQEIQGKGSNQSTGDNRANFVLCSNHKDAIRKTADGRRYAIFYTAQQEAGDLERDGMRTDNYFPRLYEWLRAEGYAIVNGYLRSYAIPDELNPAKYCHDAPRTTSTNAAIMASLGAAEQDILEEVEMGSPGFAGGWISSVAVTKLMEYKGRGKTIHRNKRRDMLLALGYVPHPALPDGAVHNYLPEGKPRLYVKKGSILANIAAPTEVVRRYLEAQTGATAAGAAFGGQQGTGRP